jgi:hypothetical protein
VSDKPIEEHIEALLGTVEGMSGAEGQFGDLAPSDPDPTLAPRLAANPRKLQVKTLSAWARLANASRLVDNSDLNRSA